VRVFRPRARRTHLIAGATAVIAVALLGATLLLATGDTPRRAPFGAYRGALNPPALAEFERWLGADVGWALDFLSDSDWNVIAEPTAWARAWNDTPYRVVYSVPLLPQSGGSLQEGAQGAYNDEFARLGRTLIENGHADAVLRLGWEFNGDWTNWSAKDDPATFSEYWRQVVRTLRSLDGARFEYDWCPSAGPAAMPADLAYPGDEYVDYIGLDAYDVASTAGVADPAQRWRELLEQPYGLLWHRRFAHEHGKPMTYPEWGLWLRSDGRGGGDNPYYVQKMHEWIRGNDVRYHMYFDYDAADGQHRLRSGRFPRSAAEFVRLFGAAGS
jgi:hypothetical protein